MDQRLRTTLGLAVLIVTGCAGGTTELACKRDPTTGSEWCQRTTSSPGDAVLGAGVAAGVYAFTGCTVNGCELPDRCNPVTKRCEPLPCEEAKACPAGYQCQLDTNTCR
jgi:hypothetical protein